MSGFAWGLVSGLVGCAVSMAAAGVWAYRRLVLLERRAVRAERLAELGTLTGGLAHEIKNPLSTIVLNLQLLEEDIEPGNPAGARVANRLHVVQREAVRLREILDDFLRYAGKIELNREPIELNALLDELVDFFSPQAQLNRVQVRLSKAGGPVMARVDVRLIKQAVLNLMINAVQAMGATGGGELILSTRAGGPRGGAVIEVIDTGPGIPAEAIDQIFEAYYSTKSGGTGLGLAMARRIVEEHGGRLVASSEVGKGSCFTVELPR